MKYYNRTRETHLEQTWVKADRMRRILKKNVAAILNSKGSLLGPLKKCSKGVSWKWGYNPLKIVYQLKNLNEQMNRYRSPSPEGYTPTEYRIKKK